MYQSPGRTPSGSRSSTPAATAASAVVTLSTPSAPSPRRRSQSVATAAGVRDISAVRSASSTKSFCVPWPLTKITCSGYVSPRSHSGLDVGGRCVGAVEPADAVVTAEPRALPPEVPPGAGVRLLPCRGQCFGSSAGIERGDHLGVSQGPGRGDAVAQAMTQQPGDLVDQPLGEHPLGALSQPLVEFSRLAV